MKRPVICVDFDGVIHSYTSGWKGIENIPDPPVDEAIEWLEEVLDWPDSICSFAPKSDVQIVIYSSRSRSWRGRRAMKKWFGKYMDRAYVGILKFPKKKPPAFLTIDDRAMCFKGTFPSIKEMLAFEPWNKKEEKNVSD